MRAARIGWLAAGCLLGIALQPAGAQAPPAGTSTEQRAVLATLEAIPAPSARIPGDTRVADAAARVDPAVVTVHTIGRAAPSVTSGDWPFPFGPDLGAQRILYGAGSGILISPDGYIVTNDHVVANAQTVTVNVGNTAYTARVVGTDPVTDIAVIKVDPKGARLPVAELGNSQDLRIGQWVIAVGNPLDVGTTVTVGIISALHRTGLGGEGENMLPAIQTDAPINPGNSGGALADMDGRVVGINEAIISPTGSSVGIGFAIPINRVRHIAAELIATGHASHPYLGIAYGPISMLTNQDRRQHGIPADLQNGAVVGQVYSGSPAAEAGLHPYDVITEANGQPITGTTSLDTIIRRLRVGDRLSLRILRDGHEQTVTATLRERPANFGLSQGTAPSEGTLP